MRFEKMNIKVIIAVMNPALSVVKIRLKEIQVFTRFEPMTSVILVQ